MNKDDSELIFIQIENEISQFCNKGEVLLCGDFNARTWELQDFIQNDDMNDNFNECPVPPNYTPEKPIIRNQLDKISNYHRNLLISLCKAMQLKLLNGRFLGDSLWFFLRFITLMVKAQLIICLQQQDCSMMCNTLL
jgi:hypothetical protein